MKRKKFLSLLLAAAMVAGVLAGCSDGQSNTPDPSGGTSETQAQPQGEKKLSLITAPASAPFPDGVTVDSSDILQFIEEKTGIRPGMENF